MKGSFGWSRSFAIFLPLDKSRPFQRGTQDRFLSTSADRTPPPIQSSTTYFVVPFAKELQLLSFFMHEHSVQMPSFHRSDLDRLVAPAHDLPGADVRHGRGHLAPLQHHIFRHLRRNERKFESKIVL